MSRPRSAMRRIREVLRLKLVEGLSLRQVAVATGLPYTTVANYVERARAAGLGWPLPVDTDDWALEGQLFTRPAQPSPLWRPQPDWAALHRELRRPSVTLMLLWSEYKEGYPAGYQYSQFCERYRRWQRHLDAVMRQEHRAGEKLFVDFAGQQLPIVDPETGEVKPAELFVAVLGASNYTYAEALHSQELPHWITAHVHTFEYLGGCPVILVPDNLRSGVHRAHRYEPDLNPTYLEMASHYQCAVIPARSRKPRDKAKAEIGVLLAERWILASLRNFTFFSLPEANAMIRQRLEWLNARPFKKLPGSRQQLFEELDRPALKPLPRQRYEFASFKTATVNLDYHIEVARHFYSVPYQLVGEKLEARLTATIVEVFHRGRRVASHPRSYRVGGFTTDPAHMPASHRRHLEWTPSRIVGWGEKTGPATGQLMQAIMASRPHPEQGFRSCLGILRLGEHYGAERVEAAAKRALAIQAFSYRSMESILKTGLDRQPLPTAEPIPNHRPHENLRGATYYE